jgi:hypothetical protein
MGTIAVSDKTLRITVANWRFGNGDIHRRHQADRANRRVNLRNQEGDRPSRRYFLLEIVNKTGLRV